MFPSLPTVWLLCVSVLLPGTVYLVLGASNTSCPTGLYYNTTTSKCQCDEFHHVINRETEHISTVEYQPTHRLPSATNCGEGTMSLLGVPTPYQPTHRLPSATNCGVGTMSPLVVPTPYQPTHRLPSATNCGVGTMSPSGVPTPNQPTHRLPSATNCGVGTMSPLGVPTPNQPTQTALGYQLWSRNNVAIGCQAPYSQPINQPYSTITCECLRC